jgi:DNA polymerase kappa
MDMFYAAVEIRDSTQLADFPVAIGDMMMIATSNYVARKFGVRSAMPGYIGVQLCPELLLIPPNYHKYQAVSKVFRDIVAEYDPEFVSLGLDEVNMDVTDYLVKNDINNEEGKKSLPRESGRASSRRPS